ncbi:ribosomal protein L7/L12, partial [Candidatus Saccharibacteria bacterium]|nr:ribosomal protein L7/L12 [Candidatus Saccharibacteria bacterium]
DAKNMAETADAKVLEAVGKDVANDAAAKLKEAGAEVAVL